MRFSFLGWAIGITLLGCATTVQAPPDNSPMVFTAVLASESTLGGVLLPNAKGHSVVYTRADRRRSANDFQFDNWLLRNTVGRFLTGNDEILRIDRNLQWQIDQKEKTYSECPLLGCARPETGAVQPERKPAKPTEKAEPEQCPLTVSRNTFKGVNTGEKRRVAGTETQKYQLTWFLELRDNTGKLATNTVTFDFWNATPNEEMQQALTVQDNFNRNYQKAINANQSLQFTLNKDVYVALAGLGASLGNKVENWAVTVGREMQKMQGYPLAISVEWQATDKTCRAANEPATKAVSVNPLDWIKGSSGSDNAAPGPLVRYTYEVKTIKVNSEHSSLFEVPAGFQLRAQK